MEFAPKDRCFYVFWKPEGQSDIAVNLVEIGPGEKLWTVCLKRDGRVERLGLFQFKAKAWCEESEITQSRYRCKDGRCPACAGCKQP